MSRRLGQRWKLVWCTVLASLVSSGQFAFAAKPQPRNSEVRKPVAHKPVAHATDGLQSKTEEEDRIAVDAFKASLVKYESVLSHKTDRDVRIQIQGRTGEILFEMAAVQFRMIHAEFASHDKSQVKQDYRETLQRIIKTENDLIQIDPTPARLPRYLFILSQAQKEIGDNAAAIATMKRLVDQFPKNKDIVKASMTLHDLLNQEKDYKTAIVYLKKLKATPQDKHYPIAMDGFAFDYYYLNEIDTAIHYLELEWNWYQGQPKGDNDQESPEQIKILKNIALFYSAGVESHGKAYTPSGLYELMRKLKAGPNMGKTLNLFGGFLRSKGRYREFEELKAIIVHAGVHKQESVDFLMGAMETELSRREFDLLRDSSTSLLRIVMSNSKKNVTPEMMDKIEKAIQGYTENLQKQYTSAPGGPDSKEGQLIRATLIALYTDLLSHVEDRKTVSGQVHFNLAELYFTSKEYAKAIPHYKWVFRENKGSITDAKVIQRSHYKAIVARFEALSKQAQIPQSVKAHSIDPVKPVKEEELSADFIEWGEWLRDYAKSGGTENLDFYYFELIQTLYFKEHLKEALAWIDKFLERFPTSKYYMTLASLKLDTYLLASRWDDVIESASVIEKQSRKTNPAFRTKVLEISADCHFKKLESLYHQKSYEDVIEQSQQFIKEFPVSKRHDDAQALAANAALGLGDKRKAVTFFDPLISAGLKGRDVPPGSIDTGLLTRAAIEEESFQFGNAVKEYLRYFQFKKDSKAKGSKAGKSDKEIKDLREKTILLAWMAGPARLKGVLNNNLVCADDLATSCARYWAILGETGSRAKRAPTSVSSFLTSLDTLKKYQHLKLEDRLAHLTAVANGWERQDAFLKYRVLSELVHVVPMQMNRVVADVRQKARLELDKRRINERVKLIVKVEKVIEKLLTLPWIRIRVSVLNDWANLYSELDHDFVRLPRPGKMTAEEKKEYNTTVDELRKPFFDKALGFRKKAFQLAVDSVVETRIYQKVAEELYKADPTVPVEKFKRSLPEMNLGMVMMAALKAELHREKKAETWLNVISDAVAQKNWPAITYLVQESTMKGFLTESQQALARAVSLSIASCQSEALAEVKGEQIEFGGLPSSYLRFGDGLGQYGVRAKEKTRLSLKAFFSGTNREERKTVLNPNHSAILVDAMEWSEMNASGKLRDEAAGWSGEDGE